MSRSVVYETLSETLTGVRTGDLVLVNGSWRMITDLRRTQAGGKAAAINGLPGVWKLPRSFDVMRPITRR
ncbi:hypothetical protein [Streptomyces nitrosporeus]|uniref:hypothetical protein n=1 Tax=Streptomyces nitrosporeus TaxID=28894 RepID=UPI003319BDB0